MNLDGSVTIMAPREKVWEFLTDAEGVSKCAPGLDSMEIITPDEKFKVVASVGFGTVKVTFTTDVEWLDLDPPNQAKVKAHGIAPGSAIDATAEMTLSDGSEKDSTEMAWKADVLVSGSIASLASRLMPSVTRKLTGAFFDCVKKNVEES
jgi:carbon monoxide dehydrogenase subunit G